MEKGLRSIILAAIYSINGVNRRPQYRASYKVGQVIQTCANDVLLWMVVTGMEKEQIKKIL